MPSPSVLFKDWLKLYVFESFQLKTKFQFEKKCVTRSILPPWSPNFLNHFFCKYIYKQFMQFFPQIWDHIIKTVFLHNFFFLFVFQAPGYQETYVNGVTNCKTSKRAMAHFYLVKWSLINWPNKLHGMLESSHEPILY